MQLQLPKGLLRYVPWALKYDPVTPHDRDCRKLHKKNLVLNCKAGRRKRDRANVFFFIPVAVPSRDLQTDATVTAGEMTGMKLVKKWKSV